MPNHYLCSDGTKVSQSTIDRKRSESYRKYDDGTVGCRGCSEKATCHAHIISQARCKQLGMTELIWNPDNWLKTCFKCNGIIENPTSEAFDKLNCRDYCLLQLKFYDPERYQKAINFGNLTGFVNV